MNREEGGGGSHLIQSDVPAVCHNSEIAAEGDAAAASGARASDRTNSDKGRA